MDKVHRIKFLKENQTPWLINLAPPFLAKYWTEDWHVHYSNNRAQIPTLRYFLAISQGSLIRQKHPLRKEEGGSHLL